MSSGVHKTFDKKKKTTDFENYIYVYSRSIDKASRLFIIDVCTLSLALSLKKIKLPEQRGKR